MLSGLLRPGCVLLAVGLMSAPAAAEGPTVLAEWRFNQATGWSGWTPSGEIRDAVAEDAGIAFRTVGYDPQILSPAFEVPRAGNSQWVEIELDCGAPGQGVLFYTNKSTGPYGGLEPTWVTTWTVSGPGRQKVAVWPFWEGLGKIIRLRVDPPDEARCRLYAIRILEAASQSDAVTSTVPGDRWQAMHVVEIDRTADAVRARALRPHAMLIAPVAPFAAKDRSLLRIDATCPGEHVIGLHWVSREHPGLMGEPLELSDGRLKPGEPIDLRQFPTWDGTITHLALAFGTSGGEVMALQSLAIEPNDAASTFMRLVHLGFERPINRPGAPAELRAVFEHAGGPISPTDEARLEAGEQLECASSAGRAVPASADGRREFRWSVVPRRAGRAAVRVQIGKQTFTRVLRVDPALPPQASSGYIVPTPHPVRTRYRIGVYYFPGWSPDQRSRWEKQAGYPEREPVLGWYAEGHPEVADWHIKWAVENAISFFVYDWYWRDGKEELGAGLNEGFLRARYQDRMKFAVMWANHKPFSSHTPAQLLAVTDYWIERYFRRSNYLTVDGIPYVSFFSPGELIENLGSEEKTAEAIAAMRERCKAAGLPGLHVAACGGPDRPATARLQRAGFDSVTGYNYLRTGANAIHSPYRQFLLGHEAIWQSMREASISYVPLLTVGWDARPWHGPLTERKFARSTRDFAEALGRLKAHLDATGQDTALLEAWNEWGEGSYIEPNAEFGFEDVEAIRTTFAEPGAWPANIGPADLGLHGRYDLRQALDTRPTP